MPNGTHFIALNIKTNFSQIFITFIRHCKSGKLNLFLFKIFRAIFRLGILWTLAAAAAGSPISTSTYFGEHFYGNNGVCLSLHIHDPYAQGWEYSAAMFVLMNTMSLLFIMVAYAKMLQAIRGSGEAMRSTLSGRENVVARR